MMYAKSKLQCIITQVKTEEDFLVFFFEWD